MKYFTKNLKEKADIIETEAEIHFKGKFNSLIINSEPLKTGVKRLTKRKSSKTSQLKGFLPQTLNKKFKFYKTKNQPQFLKK